LPRPQQVLHPSEQFRILGDDDPNQSPVAKASQECDEAGRMEPMKFTRLTSDRTADLTGRYSERKEATEKEARRLAPQPPSPPGRGASLAAYDLPKEVCIFTVGAIGLAVRPRLCGPQPSSRPSRAQWTRPSP